MYRSLRVIGSTYYYCRLSNHTDPAHECVCKNCSTMRYGSHSGKRVCTRVVPPYRSHQYKLIRVPYLVCFFFAIPRVGVGIFFISPAHHFCASNNCAYSHRDNT